MSNDEDGGRIKRLVEDLPKGGDMRRARESEAEWPEAHAWSMYYFVYRATACSCDSQVGSSTITPGPEHAGRCMLRNVCKSV